MKVKEQNVPILRFPGFGGEWRNGILGDCITSLDAGVSVLSTGKPAQDGQKGILKTSCVTLGTFIPIENKAVEDRRQIQRLKEPVTGKTIIISRMNTPALVGANAFVEEGIANLYLPDRLWAAKIKKSYVPKWVAILTSSSKLRAIFSARATGTSNSMKNITKGDVKTVPVFYPSFDEQQEISSFLTAVDTKIEQLSKKKALFEQYKKGMMQKLFSQEFRFKDEQGNDFPDWEVKRLAELVSTMKSGIGITSSNIFNAGTYPVYGGNGLRGYTEEYTHEGEYLLIGRQGALCGNINRVSGQVFISEHAIATQGNKYSDTDWLVHKLQFMNLNRLSESSAQPGLSVKKLKRLKIKSPLKPEQQKIATFLSSIDKKINLITTELNHARSFKKSLLQQMFV